MANSSQHDIYLVEETGTYGTTPSSPSMLKVRHTGTTLGLTKDGLIADELRGDRQISDHQYGVQQVGGDISSELVYDITLDAMLEGVATNTFSGGVLKFAPNTGAARKSFTIMREFTDVTVGKYHLFTGCEFNTLSLTNTANGKTVITFGVIGQGLAINDSDPLTTPTYAAATTTGMMTGTLGSLSEGGASNGLITEASFSLENGLEIKPVIGSDLSLRPSIGRCNCTGSVTAYFENGTLLDKFINGTSSSLEYTCTDAAGNFYTFEFPNIKYTGGDVPSSGEGAITLTMPFQALYDGASETNLLITASV